MNPEETKQNIKDNILQKIHNGEVKMRPKAFFMLKIAILIFVAFIIFVISVLLVSYTWFNIRTGGNMFLLSFGSRGIYEFFILFPWILLLFDIALLLVLDGLIKRFRFGYHSPVLYVFVGSLVVVTIFGSILNMTSFHKNMMQMAEKRHLPIPGVGSFYSNLRKTHKEYGFYRGEVVSIATSSFIIKYRQQDGEENTQSFEVVTPDGFEVKVVLGIGDRVFVAGDDLDGKIRAYGVKKLTSDE